MVFPIDVPQVKPSGGPKKKNLHLTSVPEGNEEEENAAETER